VVPESERYALVVSSSRYADRALRPLTAPTDDADALTELLGDRDVGGFRVRRVIDQPSWVVAEEIERFFAERRSSDIALLYFSGHGIKDEDGALYFATMNTDPKLLLATSVPSSHMVAAMQRSRSRRQVLLLDCCYAGAFSRAMVAKSGGRVGVGERFAGEGAGRVVIAASDAMQFAFEGGELQGEPSLSIFTRVLVEGIRSGDADRDGDGRISLDELYDYLYDRVREITPSQVPTMTNLEKRGDFVIALSPRATPTAAPAGGEPPVATGVAVPSEAEASPARVQEVRLRPRVGRFGRRRLALVAGALAVGALALLGAVLAASRGDGEGDAAGAGLTTTVAYDDPVTGQIEPGARDEYRFTAEEGQRINFENRGDPVRRTCDGLEDLTWSLENRSRGQSVFRDESMESCSTPSTPDDLGFELSEGAYALTIASGAGSTANYGFTLYDANPKERSIDLGQTVQDAVAPGVANVYTFTVERPQRVFVDNQPLDPGCPGADGLYWSLQHQESTAFRFETKEMGGCRDPSGPEGVQLVPGTYRLIVFGYGQPGEFQFTLKPR